MLRIGVDIVEIDRIADLGRRFGERFKRRVYSDQEWVAGTAGVGSLAARFAAKEAALKAIGERSLGYHEIEVVRLADRPPELRFHGRAAARVRELGVREAALSLSHGREYAVAMVVLQSDEPPGALV